MKHWSNQINNLVPYLPLLILLGYFVYLSTLFPLHDFSNAYYGALLLQKKLFGATVYDAWFFNSTVAQLGHDGLYLAYYPNTPFLAFFFQPLAALDPWLAKFTWNLLSCILFIVAWFRLSKFFQLSARVIFLMPFLFFLCLRNNILFGQVYFFVFFCLSEGFLAYQKAQKGKAAFWWSWAIAIKVFPILLLVFLGFKRDLKALLYLSMAIAACLILSLWSVDWSDWMFYFKEVLPKSSSGAYYDGFTAASKSLSMFLRLLFLYDPQFNPEVTINSTLAYYLISALVKSLLLAPLVELSIRNKSNLVDLMPLWMIVAMLFSPGWSSYAAVLLLFAFGAIWSFNSAFSRWHKILITGLLLLYSNLPITYFYQLPLWFQFPKVYVLLIIYILMLHNRAPFARGLTSYWILIPLLFGFFVGLASHQSYVPNDYALTEKTPLLVVDFYEKEGYLEYQYWDIEGIKTTRTNKVIPSLVGHSLTVQDHQIYYKGAQLTTDASLKRQPTMLNDSTIIYLSDRHRGMGFYTLMRLSIAPNQN